ncbi:MAG: monovalent cation/H(+) antiporter subunit G [Candidatus Dadabacteria bacterium]|nr:MAG: monovalent cation/H(+) antiporter subunit G [Candidatus Dadabacteria bacterium]
MIEFVACAALLSGTFFVALSAVGMLRLPDVFSRLHAIAKASTLGMFGILAASAIHFGSLGENVAGEALAFLFIVVTNPVGAHMIARSAYLVRASLGRGPTIDAIAQSRAAFPVVHHSDSRDV